MGAASSQPAAAAKPQQITVEFDIKTRIPVEEVIKLSEEAGRAIMTIYNSAVGAYPGSVGLASGSSSRRSSAACFSDGSQAHIPHLLCCVCTQQDHGVEYKGDHSPLTKADTESNRIICEGLQRLSPHVPIISEETKTMPYSIRKVG